MATHGHKSLAEYIHQGDLIVIADDAALAVPELWAIVPVTRLILDTRLADFKTKATAAGTVAPAYDLKVEEKDAFDFDAEKAVSMLAVYIENAFPNDAKELNHTLLIDLDYPADDEKAKQYLIEVQATLAAHDNLTYPLPMAYSDAITTATTGFITTLAEVTDLLENRRTAIQDRDLALEIFIDVLSPIRKWLWKTLPQGRKDTRLMDYGFDPYGTSSTPSEPEEPEEPEEPGEPTIPWPGPAIIAAKYVGLITWDLCVEEMCIGMTNGTWELKMGEEGLWQPVTDTIIIEEGRVINFRLFDMVQGDYTTRFTPRNADGEPGTPSKVSFTVVAE